MPGKRITKRQVKIYMETRKAGKTQLLSSARAGISERSGRVIEKGQRKESMPIRHWRTRKDPFAEVWQEELVPFLEASPSLMAITLLEYLQVKYPESYPDSLLRTLERRVKNWRAIYGPDKEVMFRQTHEPGRLGLSDFTKLKGITITITNKPLKHILYHFRLSYSRWSYLKVILGGESYTALAEGLQESLWRLGGSPLEHRTDSLSAAFKNLSEDEQEDITKRYESFCEHYKMKASRNNLGIKHENGAVESPHGHLKRRIRQALLLRGSNDFKTIEAYQAWLDQVVQGHNRRNAKQISIEQAALQSLPMHKTTDFTELVARVSSSSTIDVRRVTYTVPSKLRGEILRVHLYHDRLICYLGNQKVIILDRVYPKGKTKRARSINYRHVIKALYRKPQAFRYSQIRDELLPNSQYKEIWQYINANIKGKPACKLMVGILYLAAQNDCEEQLADHILKLIAKKDSIYLPALQNRYIKNQQATITVQQHNLQSYNLLLENYHE